MDVKYITIESNKFGPTNPPIVDGQIIALSDKNAWFYDMLGVRRQVTGQVSAESLPEDTSSLIEGTLVIVTGEADPGIYLWTGLEFVLVADAGSDMNVLSEAATSGKMYIVGSPESIESTGTLKKSVGVYVDLATGKLHASEFEGKSTDSYKSDTSKSATSASNDSLGQEIHKTYIKKLEIAGTQLTITNGDNETKTLTTTDTHLTTSLVFTDSATNVQEAAAENGNVHLNLMDDDVIRATHLIKGEGIVSVTSNTDGTLVITGTDKWVPNTDAQDGYVTSSEGQADKMWATNTDGAPGWRDIPESGGGGVTNPIEPGTYRQITINEEGAIVSGSAPTTLEEYELGDAAPFQVLDNEADLDEITTSGFYIGLVGNQILNKPEDVDGFGLIVIAQTRGNEDGEYIAQELYTATRYSRSNFSGDFGLNWQEAKEYGIMSGTTGELDGAAGMVPAPLVADTGAFLKSDGTWSAAVPKWEEFVPATTTE